MIGSQKISTIRVTDSRVGQVALQNIPFGSVFSDHMFVADFRDKEWHDLRIVPYGLIAIPPGSPALHYGQAVFEGMKAYLGKQDEVLVFRPYDHWKRLTISAKRMALAELPEEVFMEGLSTLLRLDRGWIPKTEGGSLYIRPFLFSADAYIGIRPSQNFTFMIILSPAGVYYSAPVRVKIETHYTRAVAGGTGFAKAAGNYGGSIYPSRLAQEQGYHQLLWTDGKTHEFLEESGTMNVMFIVDGVLVTPGVSDSILAGITRDSVLSLARSWGLKVEERKIGVEELLQGLEDGIVQEAFGVGTAATIAPIECIGHEGKEYSLPKVDGGGFAMRIYKELDDIKRGVGPDPYHWVVPM